MKKLILIVCAVLISTATFADIFIQQDFEGIGLTTEVIGDNKIEGLEDCEGSEFTPSYGLSFTIAYEFNSDNNAPIHYFAGLTSGVDGPGFTALVTGGLSTEIAQFGNYALALRTGLRIGPCFSLENMIIPIVQADIMFDFMKADKKGFYGSIGITDHIQNLSFPDLGMDDAHIINYTGLIFAAGYRF